MSSSGKGQSVLRGPDDVDPAWEYAQTGGRAGAGRVIVEGFVRFDYEITLLTVRHAGGTSFCAPIGHLQVDGDYRESWQPQPMSRGGARRGRAHRARGDRRARRRRPVRRRAVRARRRGLVQRGLAASARHRPRHADLAGPLRVRAARARDPGPAGAGDPRSSGPRRRARCCSRAGRATFGSTASSARSRNPTPQLRLFGKPEVSGRRRMGVTLALRRGPRRGARQGAARGGGDRGRRRAALTATARLSDRPGGAPPAATAPCRRCARCR